VHAAVGHVHCLRVAIQSTLYFVLQLQRQGVNEASLGTLSSYSWVLMVIHYLQHYAGVLPNLQVCVESTRLSCINDAART
jgi:hypothetical protein